MASGKVKRLPPPPTFLLEALQTVCLKPRQLWRGLYRRSWFYGRLLKGQLCDSIVLAPHDAAPRRLEEADALLKGRFTFGGETVEAIGSSVFDMPHPSAAWTESLHAFAWLPPLAIAGGDSARKLATALIGQWLRRYPPYSEPAYLAHIVARRLIRLFAHGRFTIANSDLMWRSQLFVSLREQTRLMARIVGEAPEGLPRFETAVALALSGLCLDDHSNVRRLSAGLTRLQGEIARQILPDGGHVSRNPEVVAEIYRLLVMLAEALAARGVEKPDFLRITMERMAPMLRFFRHNDGALALFNGATESDAHMLADLLARDESRSRPPVQAHHSGYHRLSAAHTLVMMDCGKTPPSPFSGEAHAGCLSFEMSSGSHRLVVNCGAVPGTGPWGDALKSTAAHSSVTLSDTSSAQVLAPGWLRNTLGPRLYHGPSRVVSQRAEGVRGWTVTANHDGYARLFGVAVERELTLSQQGLALTGVDRILPLRRARKAGFAVRFHIHPDVRLSRSQGGDILLKLPNGEGWRFRAGLPVAVEESIYSGGPVPRRTEQLVLYGEVARAPVEVTWMFEQIGPG